MKLLAILICLLAAVSFRTFWNDFVAVLPGRTPMLYCDVIWLATFLIACLIYLRKP